MMITLVKNNLQKIDSAVKNEYPKRPPFDFTGALKILTGVEELETSQPSDD
ncbi:hypothetical protein [Microbulbifer sp. A4B17]|uniref:hypothetical protein n=1 Tax=Microbulbifer sp. A4B17 TaxID=359370 RepID=UPI0013002ECD|nr:hypothetical protein [Microbulbifer sp. A4B17]